MRCSLPRSTTENQQLGDQNATTVTCPCARSFRRRASPVLESKRVGPVRVRGFAAFRTAARISSRAWRTDASQLLDALGAKAARIESPKLGADDGSAAILAYISTACIVSPRAAHVCATRRKTGGLQP